MLRSRRGLPPGRRAVGLRQVDEMPHDSQRGARAPGQSHSQSLAAVRRSPWGHGHEPEAKVGTTATSTEHRRCDLESVLTTDR